MASPGLVVLDYADIIADSTSDALKLKIKEAYGYDGLGILAIRGIPHFTELRERLLPLSWKLGQLPPETLAKYEHAPSYWQFGWSRGKEKLEGGRPDFSKGSFYANPVYDRPTDDPALVEAYPAFYHGNIWPSEVDAPGFEAAYKALARLITEVGTQLATHCDAYVQSELPSYPAGRLRRILSTSRTGKARLLHYFPYAEEGAPVADAGAPASAPPSESSWCGWHNDHGSLTGLTPAMFHAADGSAIPCPDPGAGLYIMSRSGETVRVVVPADHLAFQIGETSQVHSGGVLRATPHCVRAAATPGVSRSTLAVFLEPEWDETMRNPEGGDVLEGRASNLLPRGVPTLASRWKPEQNFAQFTESTLAAYH